MLRWVAAGALVLATAAGGGCGGDSSHKAAAANRVPVETTTTNPYEVPPRIDAAYVARVLAGLDHLDGEAAREVRARRGPTPAAVRLVTAEYAEPELKFQLLIWQQDATQGVDNYREVPGDRLSKVQNVLTARGDCIFAEVTRDYTATLKQPRPAHPEYVTLERAAAVGATSPLNPTPWVIVSSTFNRDGSPTRNLCLQP